MCVEQHRTRVVVALWAQWFAEPGVVAGVLVAAGQAASVRASPAVSAWTAGQHVAVVLPMGVNRAEGGSGQRGEHAGVSGHGGRDAIAAGQSGSDELVGVGSVDLGAGRATRGAAGLAGDRQEPAGLMDGGVAVEQLAGGSVDVIDAATQQGR